MREEFIKETKIVDKSEEEKKIDLNLLYLTQRQKSGILKWVNQILI